jgi:hypothetical protein
MTTLVTTTCQTNCGRLWRRGPDWEGVLGEGWIVATASLPPPASAQAVPGATLKKGGDTGPNVQLIQAAATAIRWASERAAACYRSIPPSWCSRMSSSSAPPAGFGLDQVRSAWTVASTAAQSATRSRSSGVCAW